ncbi:hypothetical protein [Candidatus Rickettsia kedanie]|uniref:Uncharacterized protein n=1 Tax=Candidatus Rickettsia kedanie TaxID=3115352 RepID=A0ABP9TTP2_9RICK
MKKKKAFILSFCQNSLNYQEALEVYVYFLRKNESEEINIAAFKGLTYIVFRFRTIKFKNVLPFIRKYVSYSMGMGTKCEYLYAASLLQDVIPKLRMKAITFLKKYSYVHLIASTFVNYVITKNKPRDQIKLEKILKLHLNNLKRIKIQYNIPDF